MNKLQTHIQKGRHRKKEKKAAIKNVFMPLINVVKMKRMTENGKK